MAPAPPTPDVFSPTEFNAVVTAITSAFGDPTRREIYLFVRSCDEGATASEVAEEFALHPNVARHHLDKLAGGGYLEVALARGQQTGAGRPSKHYRLAPEAGPVEIPVRHDDVLVTLLGRTLALVAPEEASAVAEEVGRDYGRLMAASLGGTDQHRSFRTALHSVADALTAHGFAAHTEKRNNELRIVSEHCPFGDAVLDNPVLCAVDRGMVRGMLESIYGDATAEHESSKPMGDSVCVTAIDAE